MLRKLLHERTWAKAFELTGIPVMRKHKNHIRLRIENDGTVGTETDGSDSDSERESDTTESYTSSSYADIDDLPCPKMLRQNAQDITSPRTASSVSSWGSNYGYVRYMDSTNNINLEESELIRGDCTKNIFLSIPSHTNIFQAVNSPEDTPLQKSQRVQNCVRRLLAQHSESTENSSFEVRPYMACEDLVNIDQDILMNTLGYENSDFVPTRQSFPIKVKKDSVPKLWKSTEETHSQDIVEENSITDILQEIAPPSPKLCNDFIYPDHPVIDPPPMFRNEEDDVKVINMNLNTDIPFRKHSLNSDKRIRRSLSKSMVETESFCKNNEPSLQRMSSQSDGNKLCKKCECCNRSLCPSPRSSDSGVVGSCNLASPELNLHEYAGGSTGNDSDGHEKIVENLSQGTFDDRRKNLTLSEIEAANFEDQCRCTSPFGSTARTSCVTSVTSETSLDVMDSSNIHTTSTYAATPPVSSPQIKRTSIRHNIDRYVPEIKLKPKPPPRIYRKPSTHLEIPKNVRQPVPCQWSTLNITERTKPSLHYHMRIFREKPEGDDMKTDRPSRVNQRRNCDVFDQEKVQAKRGESVATRKTRSRSEDLSKFQKDLTEAKSGFMVYRSDLYAHWWMKAKLPITVVTDSDGHDRRQ
ncbi:uncharacterized protein LOC133534287 isoform X4 [Cydia pomonella]|uniref:uncharacterized protein LOC133534287 isoform X4 n=1 Tax=Cydia pomonella TaxID=82600 RepID=UPI002ADD6127|nr:uncharacterized protein LOC133534287 isoform X4 [Cydia pomonella]